MVYYVYQILNFYSLPSSRMVKLQVLFYFDTVSYNIVQYLARDHQTKSGGLVDVASMEIRVQLSKNK